MKKRLFALLTILALVVGLLPVVSAQDDAKAQLNCLGLSADDCTIVTTAMDNFSKINSARPSFSLTEDFTGFDSLMAAFGGAGGAGTGNPMMSNMMAASSANIQGSGAVVVDHAAMTKDAPYNGVALSFDITGSSTSAGKETPVNVSVVLVDGVAYWKDDTGAWKGVALADMMQAMKNGGNMTLFGMPMSADMMNGVMGMMPEATTSPDATPEATPEIAGMNLHDLLQMPGFVSQKRLDDADMSGQKMSVFAYTGDISVVLKSPDVQKALTDMITKMSSGSAAGANAQASGAAGMMALYIPVLLDSTTGTITLTRWIGADDQFVHQVALDVTATINLNGDTTGTTVTPLPPVDLKLNVTFTLDKINDTTAPTAPTGATMVTPADLMPEQTPEATPA